jgi:signal transduction histidine kinase/CheY-like chemotaxis protein
VSDVAEHNPGPSCSGWRSIGLVGCWLLAAVTGLGDAAAVTWPPPVVLTDRTDVQVSGNYLALLHDDSRALTLADVTDPALAGRFRPAGSARIPNSGITKAAIWARFEVHNATGSVQALQLELRDARVAFADVWVLHSEGGPPVHSRLGRYVAGSSVSAEYRYPLVALPLATGETATVLIRERGFTSVLLDLRIAPLADIAADARHETFWLGLFFGAMGIMGLYNALLFLQLREPPYLWLALIIFGVVLWRLDFDGLLVLALPALRGMDLPVNAVGAMIAIAATPLYAIASFAPARLPRHLVHLSYGIAAGVLALPLLHLIGYPIVANLLLNLSVLVVIAIAVRISIVALREPTRAAWIHLLAWVTVLVGMLVIIALNLDLLPGISVVRGSTYYISLGWLLLLSVAQADKVTTLRKGAERANRLLRDNEARLERQVTERTRDLARERDAAEAASRTKTRFLAQMSHELRTPLNAVLGFADLLRRSPELGERARACSASILRGGRQLLHLIEDLIDVAAIEAGRPKLMASIVNLPALLRDIDHHARRQAGAKGLAFYSEIAPGLPGRIEIDERRLRQLLQNLLDNAVKYTDSGCITLRAEPSLGLVPGLCFQIEDTGCGIPESDQERLFQPFEQLHPGQPGSGLGLTICREVALLLNGCLTLDSLPGHGSRFSFELPVRELVSEQDADVPSDRVVGYRGRRRRVLAVDDDQANRMFLAAALEQLGFIVDLADGLTSAVAAACAQTPELVLMDMLMPDGCGYAAAWAVREQLGRADLPVIVASAWPLTADDIRELGLDGFIAKPIDRASLIDAIGGCLELSWIEVEGPATVRLSALKSSLAHGGGTDAPELPPRIELDAVAELARCGELDRVRDWCDDMASAAPEYGPFVAQVRSRAAQADGPALADWLAAVRRAPLPLMPRAE